MTEKIVKNPSITSGDFVYDTTTGEVSAIAGKVLAGANAKYSFNGTNGISVTNDESKKFTFGLTDSAYGAVQYVTANSGKFVTSGDYISGSKQYALTSGGWKEITASQGGDYTAGTDLKIDENNVISVDTNGNANNTATNNRNFVEGSWTIANGYNCHAEGIATSALGYGVHAQGMWTCFSSTNGQTTGGLAPIYWGIGAGAAVEGYCNATTACPMSGTVEEESYGPIHGGILKVIGNGYVENEVHETDVHEHYPSDALILYRDGSMWVQGPISANGVELGGGTSYQGRNGINVADDYIELTQTAYNAVTSVSSKVDKPDTTQTEFNNKYLGYSTLSGQGQTTGWIDLGNNFYSKSEANGTFVNKTTYNADKATFLTINKAFVSGTNFDTLGQSRLENDICLGTNWMGVSVSHAGFFKFIDGQNPGDTYIDNAGSGIQVEFKPDRTQGELNIINTYAGTETTTKVVNVPAASYTNMSAFDSENGPNYMLRKTANGFDIGAAVINTTALPANVQANAYYFIYEM